jgi:GNAT superfamily N-acetyltransferase
MMRLAERVRAGITRIRPHDPDEIEAVMAFQRAHFPEDNRRVFPECRTWLYDQNPYAGEDGPLFWVYRPQGEILGQQSEIPFDLQIGDRRRLASWAIDLMVDPRYRLRGVGPVLVATLQEHRDIVGVLDASPEGYAALVGNGYTDLGPLPVYRRPLDARRALELPRVPAWARRLVPLASAALRLADLGAAAVTRLAGLRLVPVDRFDERVDEVWDAAAGSYPVLACRDHKALAWRIDQRPDCDRLRRYYLVHRRQTVGYAVLRPTMSSGHATATVVDYLAQPRWVAPMLLAVSQAAKRDGVVALTLRTRNHSADRALKLIGFSRRFGAGEWPIHNLLHCTAEPETCQLLQDPDNWFLTAADSDLEPAIPETVAHSDRADVAEGEAAQ